MQHLFKDIFYPVFFLLFLLSFFLIEGEYKFYLFALWAIFLFFASLFLQKKSSKNNRKSASNNHLFSWYIVFALILSALFILGLFFSRQIPRSIEKLIFYLISLASFIFFSSTSKSYFKPRIFFYYLSILTLVLNIIVLFLTFYHGQHDFFPGMNLLVRIHGHNHYAAFLLLVIPVFWWQLLFREDEKNVYEDIKYLVIILLALSYLLIILSLARLVLFISIIQLIFIFVTNKEVFYFRHEDKFIRTFIKTFIFAFLSIGMFFLLLSMPLNKNEENLCPLIFSKKEICKPLLKNDRLVYWKQAYLLFKKNPMFGVGLKNFNFASRQFPIQNRQITSYAHNIFLHNLAENGFLVGGFFIFFIIYLFYRSFLIMRKNTDPLYGFLWPAAFASLINAMFDFDWNFFVIFTLTLIFLALILQEDNCRYKHRTIFYKGYYILLLIISVFVALYNLTAQILSNSQKYNWIIRNLPYADRQIRFLIKEEKLSSNDFSSLYLIYRYDIEFIYKFLTLKQLDLDRKLSLQLEFAELDPAAFINNVKFDDYNFIDALPIADKIIQTTNEYNFLNNLIFFDYWEQKNIAAQFFTFANQAYEAGKPDLASNYYQKAIFLNEFIMGDRKAFFLDDLNFSSATAFLKYFKDLDPNAMNQYFYEYMIFYERTLIYLFQTNQMEDFFLLAESMFGKQYNFSWFLWRDLIAASKSAEDRQRLKLVYEHFQDMTTWSDFLPLPEYKI